MEDPNQEKKSRFDLQPHYIEWGLTALGVIVACVLVVFVLFRMTTIWGIVKKFFSILSPFIYGFVMAYLLMPVFNMLYRNLQPPMSRKFKNGTRLAKGLCSALTLAFGLAVVGVLLWMVLPQLVTSITSLVDSMDLYMNEISGWVASLLHNNPEIEHSFMRLYDQFSAQIMNWAQNDLLPQLVTSITSLVDSMDLYMNEISGWVASLLHNNPEIEHSFMRLYDQFSAQIMNWAQNDLLPQLGSMMSGVVTTVNVLMNLLIGVIIALYILNSKDTFCAQAKKMTYSFFTVEKANAIMARVAHIHRVFGGFITGKLMDSSIIGVLCFIGMRLMISFGWMTMPTSYAILIAVIIGVTNIIPFFGPFIGAIPSTILIMVISPVQALYFVIFVLLLQQFDGNILGPKILGNATGLSSFWVMFAILLFGGVMGFAGMVIGVPLFAVLYSVLTEKINHLLKKRGLSVDTNDYRGHKRIDPETHAFVEAQETTPPVSAKERRRAANAAQQQKDQQSK